MNKAGMRWLETLQATLKEAIKFNGLVGCKDL